MGLYKLRADNGELESDTMEPVISENIDFEKDFENWLENSPSMLLEDDDKSTVLWIGRQVNVTVGDIGKYPDLLGIDADGDLVIVELKKGKTPREVIAQILEYASWGAALSYEDLNQVAMHYFAYTDTEPDRTLEQAYLEVFYPDDEDGLDIHFNVKQKLFIVAEEISQTVRQVATYLRSRYTMDIHCLRYQVYKTQQGDYLISTERVVGYEQSSSGITLNGMTTGQRWNEPISIRDAIMEAVRNITNGDSTVIISPIQVISEVKKSYPTVNKSTVRCQLIADCVNHTSRKHYQSNQDLYYLVEKGKYRLYNPEKDGKWNDKGERV
ncbi:MAG: DUF7669 domain-containing protein [Fastidiosipilaceae bacterium]|jgi:hypothetical protein